MKTRNGKTVHNVNHHIGLLRGTVVVGKDRDSGRPIERRLFWYPDGRLTPARATAYDLVTTGDML
jgi:hypothetical protein